MNTLRAMTAPFAAVRRNLMWFLSATYVVAALLPGLGNELRRHSLGSLPFSGESLNPTHLLLGVLLFCVGIGIRPDESRNLWRLTRSVSGGLVGSWLLPPIVLALLAAVGSLLFDGLAWQAFLTGAILVAAMPPANSSSIWSELSGGPAVATISVIVLGTLVSPLATPAVVGLFGFLFGGAGAGAQVSTASMLEVLFAFVMLPAALGIAVRALLDATISRWVSPLMELSRAASLVALLLLNYVNASAALPELVSGTRTVTAGIVALLSIGLCAAVFGAALAVSRRGESPAAGQRLSFVYVTSMKNTGAALVLAASLFPDQPLVALVPVLYTLSQHFAAAMLDRLAVPRRTCAPPELLASELNQASTPSY